MKRVAAAVLLLLMLTALVVALAGCGSSGSSQPSDVGGVVENAQQQANSAAREANLRLIDSAIQQYFAENGVWPTSISQISQYFAKGVPTDPAGGTYYIVNTNGEAKAAVQ